MKIHIDKEMCRGTGCCENICPRVFKIVQGISRLRISDVPAEAQRQCRLAAQNCPNKAISVEVREIALYVKKAGGVI
jgi:ferredoxin